MTRYYVDTNVWLDFLESRRSFLKPFGEFAFQFLKRCIEREYVVLYSDLVLDEISIRYSLDDMEKHCFSLFDGVDLLEHVDSTKKQKVEALMIAKTRNIPRSDAVHAILARDNNAVIVTRDKHFNLLSDIVDSLSPEEVT